MIETQESRAKWRKSHEAAKALSLGRRPVKGVSDEGICEQKLPACEQKLIDKKVGRPRTTTAEQRKAYRKDWMRRNRKDQPK